MRGPRSAAAAGKDFPYRAHTTCYIEVHDDGTVSQGVDVQAYQRAVAGTSRLYAVWPGEWSSDLFAIDDLDEYARAVGILHDVERTGLADHDHQVRWQPSAYNTNPRASYLSVEVFLDCGCTIHDLDVFAAQMRAQQGWDVATSGGWSGSGNRYTLRIRRKSLTP